SVRPDDMFALLERERVTLTTLVPPVVRLWIDAARKSGARFPDLLLQVGSSKFDTGRAADVGPGIGAGLTQWFGVGEGLLTYTRLDDPEEVAVGTEDGRWPSTTRSSSSTRRAGPCPTARRASWWCAA